MTAMPEPAARSWNWLKVIFFQFSVSSVGGVGLGRLSHASEASFSALRVATSLVRMLRLCAAWVVKTPRWYSK